VARLYQISDNFCSDIIKMQQKFALLELVNMLYIMLDIFYLLMVIFELLIL